MQFRRLMLTIFVGLSLTAPAMVDVKPLGLGGGVAEAAKGVRKGKKKSARARVVCRGKGKARKCSRVKGRFAGRGVPTVELRQAPLPAPSGRVHLVNVNFREEVVVDIYRPDGSFDEAALAQLDKAFRCRRTGESHAVDPRLYEVLSLMYDRFGGKPIMLVSGFRFQRNEGSRHFHASAMDIRVEGVSADEIYDFARSLDPGGMGIGIYPREGFVHVDFRAPGEPSYRWTDTSRGDTRSSEGKKPSKLWRSRKPNT